MDDILKAPNRYDFCWDNLSDDFLLSYSANLDLLPMNMWYDVLACNDPTCGNSRSCSIRGRKLSTWLMSIDLRKRGLNVSM